MAISNLEYYDNSDVSLIRRTRAGDTEAFGLLFSRHRSSAMALAWRVSRSAADADDLVAEASARVLASLLRGRGPDIAFRPYLLSAVRRLAYDRTDRERREIPAGERELEPVVDLTDPVLDDFERTTAAAAFSSLPERWRMVLWHTEVEGQSPAEVAVLLGMKPNSVAALAYRAHEGLRQAYLTNHAIADPLGNHECRRTNDRLAAYVRGGLAPATKDQVGDHLDSCDRCQSAYLELTQVNSSMRSAICALVLGPAAGGYLASIGIPTAPAVVGKVGLGVAGSVVGRRSVVRTVRAQIGRANPIVAGAAAAAIAIGVAVAIVGPGSQELAASPPTTPPASVRSTRPAPPGAPRRALPAAVTTTTTTRPESLSAPGAEVPDPPLAIPATPLLAAPVAATPAPTTTTSPTAPTTTTTSTTTTSPATTTTTEPPVPGKLHVDLSSAGGMVSGRPGVVVAEIDNTGFGQAGDVIVTVSLRSMTTRRLATLPTGIASASAQGWQCQVASVTSIICRSPQVAAGAHESIYLPVSVPSGVDLVGAEVAATGQNVSEDPQGQTTSVDMAVQPDGMAARFATVDHGGITVAGAGLLTCSESEPACAAARNRQGTNLDNGSFVMTPIDIDGDPATLASSRSSLDLPSDATVLSAQLYWGGDLTAGSGGDAAADPDRVGRVRLTDPSGSATWVDAERVDHVGSRYQGVVDITDLVAQGGDGSWTLADAQLGTGRNRFGGWSLVVAYRSALAPVRSLVVLDGLREVQAGSSASFDVGGFLVPTSGAGASSVWVQAYDGDAGLAGDQLSVEGQPLVDAANPVGDSFNATLSDGGALHQGAGVFANTFGFDLDRFDLAGVLDGGATNARIDLTTNADVYLPGVVAIAVDQ